MTALPRPAEALAGLHGLTADEFRKLVKHARDTGLQLAPTRGIDRFWVADLHGYRYCFAYYNLPGVQPGRYSIQSDGLSWAIVWRASAKPSRVEDKPFIRAELVTVSARICFDFSLEGDVEQYRHDMSLLRTFLD